MPELITVNPRKIIPYHESKPTFELMGLYLRNRQDLIPPIPLVQAPSDLKFLGDYVNYNGHHRTASAIATASFPQAYLIKTNQDLEFLAEKDEVYEELIQGLDIDFQAHYNFVCDQARAYAKLMGRLKSA